jgi:hypothetical protein
MHAGTGEPAGRVAMVCDATSPPVGESWTAAAIWCWTSGAVELGRREGGDGGGEDGRGLWRWGVAGGWLGLVAFDLGVGVVLIELILFLQKTKTKKKQKTQPTFSPAAVFHLFSSPCTLI